MMYPYADSLLDPKNNSRRVSRACDRCRLKKTKCDGRRCCNRCLADDAICIFSKRKRSSDRPYSPEYVQLLEDQQMKLVEGVQELYRRLRRNEGWTGPKIAEDSQGYPLVQDVLDSLAVLAPSERKVLSRKLDDASHTEQDEDEEDNIPGDGSAHLSTTTPPLTPPEFGQSSSSNSPLDDDPQNGLGMAYMPNSMQQLSEPMAIGQDTCPLDHVLQNQSILTDGSDFWQTPSPYGGGGGTSDLSGLNGFMDPFIASQPTGNWYGGSFMMM